MSDTRRSVYVISDLHLGGAPPQPTAVGADEAAERARRGFRMMTEPRLLAGFIHALASVPDVELVINGDFVDFLAERHEGNEEFRPFIYDEDEAVAVFRRIAGWIEQGRSVCELGREEWDPLVFDALRGFLAAGRRLTVLLGNHDLELCLPKVREELVHRLGGGELHMRYDGEALPLGADVLIEHGNLYDRANVVDQQGLRKLRAELTRGLAARGREVFTPPVGSRIVAEVMNPIKSRYGFIDLLKPESEPLFALLLAIEPDARARLGPLLRVLGGIPVDPIATMRGPNEQGSGAPQPAMRGGQSRGPAMRDGSRDAAPPDDAVTAMLSQLWSLDEANAFLKSVASDGAGSGGTTRSVGGWLTSKLALVHLMVGAQWMGTPARLGAIRRAMRSLETDRSFDPRGECKTYADWAAQAGREGGYRCVIFGHTHHAKDLVVDGVRYLNSGTWANLMAFPVLSDDDDTAQKQLEGFLDNVRQNMLGPYIRFAPTYVRVELLDGQLRDVGVFRYDAALPFDQQPRFTAFDEPKEANT